VKAKTATVATLIMFEFDLCFNVVGNLIFTIVKTVMFQNIEISMICLSMVRKEILEICM
jgi:hypothetical protein